MPVVATATNPLDAAPAAFGALPIASVALTGSAAGGSGVFATWQWTLLAGPPGHSASIAAPTSQNTTLDNVDVWGDYLLMLVATDSLGESSEDDPRKAPDSARTVVRVTSEHTTLIDPAAGERNTDGWTREWVEEIDTLRDDLDTQTIADHDTTATGAELDTLTGGGSATGLHTHAGADVAVATTSTLGTVVLDGSPAVPAAPKVINRERVPFTAMVNGTLLSTGFSPGTIQVPYASAVSALAHAFWYVAEALTIDEAVVALGDAGGGAGSWTFQLWELSDTAFKANDYTAGAGKTLIGSLSIAVPGTPHSPEKRSVAGLGHTLSAGSWLCVLCSAAPAEPGAALSVNLMAQRRV